MIFKSIFKNIIIQLSNNEQVLEIAKRILVYFPRLKSKLLKVRDNAQVIVYEDNISSIYEDDFLDNIKAEIESKKEVF